MRRGNKQAKQWYHLNDAEETLLDRILQEHQEADAMWTEGLTERQRQILEELYQLAKGWTFAEEATLPYLLKTIHYKVKVLCYEFDSERTRQAERQKAEEKRRQELAERAPAILATAAQPMPPDPWAGER